MNATTQSNNVVLVVTMLLPDFISLLPTTHSIFKAFFLLFPIHFTFRLTFHPLQAQYIWMQSSISSILFHSILNVFLFHSFFCPFCPIPVNFSAHIFLNISVTEAQGMDYSHILRSHKTYTNNWKYMKDWRSLLSTFHVGAEDGRKPESFPESFL